MMNILLKLNLKQYGVRANYGIRAAVNLVLKRNLSLIPSHLQEHVTARTTDLPGQAENEDEEEQTLFKEAIGFIGLGAMGNRMGMTLLKRGYNLVVYDINAQAMEPFESLGSIVTTSPKEVAEQVSRIITSLPTSSDVQTVYNGNRGIFQGIQPGTLLIDTSTIEPNVSKDISQIATSFSSVYMDCPILDVVTSEDSSLTFACGGSDNDFKAAEAILKNLGKNVMHCGQIGCGQSAKICNNLLLAVCMIGTSEVMNLGIRLGLDKKMLSYILNISTGRCWSSEFYNPCPDVLSGIPPSNGYKNGSSTQLMTKTLALAQDASTDTKSPIPLGGVAYQLYNIDRKSVV